MIRIENIYEAKIAFQCNEVMSYGRKASGIVEHQICEKILKMLMENGFMAEVSTNAELPKEVGEFT